MGKYECTLAPMIPLLILIIFLCLFILLGSRTWNDTFPDRAPPDFLQLRIAACTVVIQTAAQEMLRWHKKEYSESTHPEQRGIMSSTPLMQSLYLSIMVFLCRTRATFHVLVLVGKLAPEAVVKFLSQVIHQLLQSHSWM